ncbi:MAG: putative rhamnosyl transferase, partial [Lactococcus lactis]|nr:putative rhamnosyl transferase [Lactococcus lactis]
MILHTLLIRYSLLSEDLKAWKISRADLESYRKQLFDEDRLNERFEMFKNITLPSLLNQKDINEKIGETNLNKIQVFIA